MVGAIKKQWHFRWQWGVPYFLILPIEIRELGKKLFVLVAL